MIGQTGTGNNWAKGYYTEGTEYIDMVMEAVRKEIEPSDSFQGFQVTHSIGGGTGSGMGSLIIKRLEDEYFYLTTQSFTLFPSLQESSHPFETFNSSLAMNYLVE